MPENLPRVLPDGCRAVVDASAWRWPEVFRWLQAEGRIAVPEMFRTFNCGIGMVVVLPEAHVDAVVKMLADAAIGSHVIGRIEACDGQAETVIEGMPAA